jgi:transposase
MDEPQNHALGLSRGGRGTKVYLATERRGLPLAFVLTAGEAHEAPVFLSLMARAREARPRLGLPDRLASDKAYASEHIRRWLQQRHIRALIPPKSNQHMPVRWTARERGGYRGRNVVERCVGRLKEFRRLATRYEKLALNFGAMVTLAMIVIYLKAL